jgi:vesicle-associated membrane protein 7
MADQKLRCALVYRLEAGKTVNLAKYDHASQYESHGGAAADETSLYGGKDKSYAEAVAKVIANDPPSGLSEAGTIGGFKVVQSDQHQVVYGADSDGICTYLVDFSRSVDKSILVLTLVFQSLAGMGVITGLGYPSRVAIQMLQELYKQFMDGFKGDCKTAAEGSLTKKGKKVLTDCCTKYDDLSKMDKAASLLGKVDGVKATMQTNIANMLKNTEQADSLAEKSDQLNEQASVFKKKSGDLRKQMAWKNMKMTLILGGIIVVILIVILAPLISKMKKHH